MKLHILGGAENNRSGILSYLRKLGLPATQLEVVGKSTIRRGYILGSSSAGVVIDAGFFNHSDYDSIYTQAARDGIPLLAINSAAKSASEEPARRFCAEVIEKLRQNSPSARRALTAAEAVIGGEIVSSAAMKRLVGSRVWLLEAEAGPAVTWLQAMDLLPSDAAAAKARGQGGAVSVAFATACSEVRPTCNAIAMQTCDYLESGGFKGRVPEHEWRQAQFLVLLDDIASSKEKSVQFPVEGLDPPTAYKLAEITKRLTGCKLPASLLVEWRRGLSAEHPYREMSNKRESNRKKRFEGAGNAETLVDSAIPRTVPAHEEAPVALPTETHANVEKNVAAPTDACLQGQIDALQKQIRDLQERVEKQATALSIIRDYVAAKRMLDAIADIAL